MWTADPDFDFSTVDPVVTRAANGQIALCREYGLRDSAAILRAIDDILPVADHGWTIRCHSDIATLTAWVSVAPNDRYT